jgi:redox-sensitive bicupin YhaK (pirin superfamily)
LVHHAPPNDAEVIIYVREGAMVWEDTSGAAGVISAGEFQRTSASTTLHRDEQNASPTEWNVALEMWLRAPAGRLGPGQEQERFSAAERRDRLCLVASPDGRRGSLHLHQSAFIFSALLDAGQHLVHELAPNRVAWVHVVQGELELGGLILTAGDGAGITAERSVSFTAREEAEVLLLDLEPLR